MKIVIEDWMITELGLYGPRLIAFAVYYTNEKGEIKRTTSAFDLVSILTALSKEETIKILRELADRELLIEDVEAGIPEEEMFSLNSEELKLRRG